MPKEPTTNVIHATKQLRGYCTKNGYLRIRQTLQDCATLYNSALQERRDAWKMQRVSISRNDQTKQFTLVRHDMGQWKDRDVTIGRGVLCRVDRTFADFFRRAKAGQKPGFPRFRSRNRYSCIELSEVRPGMLKTRPSGRKAYIRIKGLPIITLRLKKPLPEVCHLKGLRINLRDTGLDVDLIYQLPKTEEAATEAAIGLDLGVNNRVTLSTGEAIERREAEREREDELRRRIGNSKKGSNSRRKKVAQLRRHSRRSRVRNRNACHRITTRLTTDYSRIAVEHLNIGNMTASAKGTMGEPGSNVRAKAGLNRSLQEQSWGILLNQLRYKAEWAGSTLVEVDPRYTSQTCSRCNTRRQEPLPEYRTFQCNACGLSMDRDHNAAINILTRAFGPDPSRAGIPLPLRDGARTTATPIR